MFKAWFPPEYDLLLPRGPTRPQVDRKEHLEQDQEYENLSPVSSHHFRAGPNNPSLNL